MRDVHQRLQVQVQAVHHVIVCDDRLRRLHILPFEHAHGPPEEIPGQTAHAHHILLQGAQGLLARLPEVSARHGPPPNQTGP